MAKNRTLLVSPQLLAQALNLPEGTVVRDLRFVAERDLFEFRVEHEDFDDLPVPPIVVCTIDVLYHNCPADGSIWQKLIARWTGQ